MPSLPLNSAFTDSQCSTHMYRRMTPATYAFSFIPDYVLPEVPAGTSGGMFFDFPSFGITKNVYIHSIICLPVQYYRIFL